MVMQYDYDSKHSQAAMKKITRFLVGRWGKGATQSQIAAKTGMTTPTVDDHLTRDDDRRWDNPRHGRIHVSGAGKG